MPMSNNNAPSGMGTLATMAISHFLRRLITAVAGVGVLCYAAAALLTVADIIGSRFGLPIVGVIDLVQLFVLAGAWLVIPYAFVAGAHVGVDLVVDMLPTRWRRLIRALMSVVAVVLLSLILNECFKTYELKVLFGDRSQQLGIPITWYWLPLLAGVALSIVAAALTIFVPPESNPPI